jgi:hypothetical protein
MKTNPIRQRFLRTLSLFIMSLLMAFVVWAIAINAVDPMEKKIYPDPLTLEVVGLGDQLILSAFTQPQIEVILTAPRSSWTALTNDPGLVHAYVDLSGLAAGEADLELKVTVDQPAVRLEDAVPRSVHVRLVSANP